MINKPLSPLSRPVSGSPCRHRLYVDGYETRQVSLFNFFVRLFGVEPSQNTLFFGRITNQKFRLIYSQVTCETKTKDCAGSRSIQDPILSALFLLLKISSFS